MLVRLAVAIALGAANLSEAEQLQFRHRPLSAVSIGDRVMFRAGPARSTGDGSAWLAVCSPDAIIILVSSLPAME